MFLQVLALAFLCVGVQSRNVGTLTLNSDGTSNVAVKKPFLGDDKTLISGIASKSSTGVMSEGLAFDYANGNGLSVSHTSIPGFGSQLTGAGRLNLVHNDNHNLDANGFITRNMPSAAELPNFNTYGGNLDYMYKDRIGATLGAAKTPLLERTDYSAMGKLNLFHSPSSSFDLNAGFSKSMSPHFSTDWQPSAGLSFTKYW